MFPGVILHRLGRAAVGVAFTQHGVHGGAEHFGITGACIFLSIGCRNFGEVGQRVTFGLQLGDGRLELRDGGADVWQLDDVCLGLEGERTEFGEIVVHALGLGQEIRKDGENACRHRDVACLHRNARVLCVGLNDRQEGVSGESGSFVGLRVDDDGLGGHVGGIKKGANR